MRLGALVLAILVATGVAVALAQPHALVVAQPVAGPDNDQFSTASAMAADGSFAVAYEEQASSGNSDVVVRRFNADLSPAGAAAAVNDTADRRWGPAIAMAPDGRYVVAYVLTSAGDDDIRAQRFAANGMPVGAEIEVNTQPGQQYQPSVAMAPSGAFLVAWTTTGARVAARAFGADGSPLTAAGTIDTAGSASEPSVAADPGGAYIVAWDRQTASGDPGRVMARRFQANGTPDGADFAAFTGATNQNYGPPAIGLAGDGTYVLVFPRPVGAQNEVVVQRQGAAAFKANDTFVQTLYPSITVEDDGHYTVAWEDHSGASLGLRTRRFGPDDAPDGPSQHAGSGGAWNPTPSTAGDRHGRVVIAFTASDTGGFNRMGAYLSRFDAEGVAPPPAQQQQQQAPPPGAPAGPAPTPPAPVVVPVRGTPPAATPLPAFASVVTLPSARKCVSRRNFRIRIARRRGLTIARAEVAVNGKRVKVVRGARLTAPVNLTTLPRGRFRVDITVVTADGRTLKGTRKYRTCTPKRRGGKRPRL